MHRIIAVALFFAAAAQAAIIPGDVAIVSYESDGTDDPFSVLALSDIANGDGFEMWDGGYADSGQANPFGVPGPNQGTGQGVGGGFYRGGENVATWTNNTGSVIPAGTIIGFNNDIPSIGLVTGAPLPTLTDSGDQIFLGFGAFNGSREFIGSLLFGLHMNGDWDALATTSNESAEPSALSGLSLNFPLATYTFEQDNAYYNGPRVGTQSDLLAAITTPGNWVTSNSLLPAFDTTSFSIVPEPSTYALLGVLLIAGVCGIRRRQA